MFCLWQQRRTHAYGGKAFSFSALMILWYKCFDHNCDTIVFMLLLPDNSIVELRFSFEFNFLAIIARV
jgi:hypothetical protein